MADDTLMADARPRLAALTLQDAPAAAAYLAAAFAGVRSESQWLAALTPPWVAGSPNLGFQLVHGGRIRGLLVATYTTGAQGQSVCHIGTWHVDPEYRFRSLSLLRAVLAQDIDLFTDFTASGEVQRLNRRFGFEDVTTPSLRILALRVPLRAARLRTDPGRIAAALTGYPLDAYRAHRGIAGLGHLVVEHAGAVCYVAFRRRRARLTSTEIVFVSDQTLFERVAPHVFLHLLLHARSIFVRADESVLGYRPHLAWVVEVSVRQFRARDGVPATTDYLFSPMAAPI